LAVTIPYLNTPYPALLVVTHYFCIKPNIRSVMTDDVPFQTNFFVIDVNLLQTSHLFYHVLNKQGNTNVNHKSTCDYNAKDHPGRKSDTRIRPKRYNYYTNVPICVTIVPFWPTLCNNCTFWKIFWLVYAANILKYCFNTLVKHTD